MSSANISATSRKYFPLFILSNFIVEAASRMEFTSFFATFAIHFSMSHFARNSESIDKCKKKSVYKKNLVSI